MIGATLSRNSVFALAAAMLFGCGGMNSASSPWYQSPPGLTAADGATVTMSQNQAGGPVADGDTRVVTVDGQKVSPMEWDKIVLPPGQHSLGVQYNGLAAVATVRLQASLKAGATYEVKGERTGPCDAALWLAPDGSDRAGVAKSETHLMAKPSRNGYSVMAVVCN
jgi:hypothetical protein